MVTTLLEALNNNNKSLRYHAVLGLGIIRRRVGELKDEEKIIDSIGNILLNTNAKDIDIRVAAVSALEEFKSQKSINTSIPYLRKALNIDLLSNIEYRDAVGKAAVESIAELARTSNDALELLKEIYRKHGNSYIKRLATGLLKKVLKERLQERLKTH